MQSATKTIFVLISFTLILAGLADIAQQLRTGEELEWKFPIIIIGFGSIFPVLLLSFPSMFDLDDAASDSGSGDDADQPENSSGGGGGSAD